MMMWTVGGSGRGESMAMAAGQLGLVDKCIHRLIEISAELSMARIRAESGSPFIEPEPSAITSRPARKVLSSRSKRRRARRGVIPSVVGLEDRDLATAGGLGFDFGALVAIPEVRILKTTGTRFGFRPQGIEPHDGTEVRVSDPYLWDLAIDQLSGTGSSQHVRVASEGTPVAA
jgi:hypothetical protein